jgi:hypothetical protein
MKVLTTQDGATILTFPCFVTGDDKPGDATGFYGLDGKAYAEGVVTERPDAMVARATVAASKRPVFEYMEPREFMRDLRWIGKALAREDAADGTVVKARHTSRGYGLDVQAAKIDRAADLAVGDRIAVGPNITPKAMMNAHGVVKALGNGRVVCTIDAGDLDRVRRATGKRYAADLPLPRQSIEKIEA